MSKKDYEKFLFKIDQLNQLVELINNISELASLFFISSAIDKPGKICPPVAPKQIKNLFFFTFFFYRALKLIPMIQG